MNDFDQTHSCLLGEELVSYIYDELLPAQRTLFEAHLTECSDCVNEFALVAESRLGVFEWHRDEFVTLDTPTFSIPYRTQVSTSSWTGWIAWAQSLFTPVRFAAASGFAVFAVAFGLLYFYANLDPVMIAERQDPSARVAKTVSEVPSVPRAGIQADVTSSPMPITVAAATRPSSVQASKTGAFKAVAHGTSRNRSKTVNKAPRLGGFDDVEDTSLRLSDLVADIDSDDFR